MKEEYASINSDEVSHETINIIPDKSLIPKIGKTGYSIPQAIAELIDNSIDARNDNEKLIIEISINQNFIEVIDNGHGMTKEVVSNAMKLAHSIKSKKLGEYGLGLKTACMSLGKSFSINTTTRGNRHGYHIKYNEKQWTEDANVTWEKYPIQIIKKKNLDDYGTRLKISDLIIKYLPTLSVRLIKDFSMRYAPYIKNNEITIKVNNKKCAVEEPILTDSGKQEFSLDIDRNKIYGWYGLLKEGSQKGFYGFTTFRRGRMITFYDKIGIPEHPTVARIVGEIHLDHIPVTYNKREFIKESEEYTKAEEMLSEVFKDLVRDARKKAGDDKLSPQLEEKKEIWMDKISEVIKLPEIKEKFPNMIGDVKKETNKPDDLQGEDVDIEKRDKPIISSIQSPKNPIEERERIPKKIQTKKLHSITIKGKRYTFIHKFANLGIERPWKEWVMTERGIEIYTNKDFPAFLTTKDIIFYAVLHVSESLSEIIVKESGEPLTQIQEMKEFILRKSAELVSQFKDEGSLNKDGRE